MKFTPESLGWYYIAGGTRVCYPIEYLWPDTYLNYAKEDYDEGKESRNLINAVSNAKRALHYQVDTLAKAYGFSHIKTNNNFPSKLEYLGKCGITAPNIIRRVNKFRNTIEHDYYTPTQEEAEEYIDIVELYLLATKKAGDEFPDQPGADLMSDDEEYDKSLGYPESIEIFFPEGAGTMKIVSKEGTILDIDIKQQEYFEWVSALVEVAMA